MITKTVFKDITWIDLENPTREELRSVVLEYAIPSIVSEELLSESVRSKVELYDSCIFMVLHFPAHLKAGSMSHHFREIDFVVGHKSIITTHYEFIDGLHEFSKMLEIDSVLSRGMKVDHAGFLFYHMLRELYQGTLRELEGVNSSLKAIEHLVFNNKEQAAVHEISKLNRELLNMHQAFWFHPDIISSFETAGKDFFGSNFAYYLGAIMSEYNKVHTNIEGLRELLRDLHETNDSLLTSKTNEVIRVLTIMNFIALPLGLITWIFGMTSSFPLVTSKSEFFLVLGGMALVGISLFIYFKTRKWL